jgi:ferredoxin
MKSWRVTFQPRGRTVDVEEGRTLLEAAESAGVEIQSACGGQGICGQCKVRVTAGEAPITDAEYDHLNENDIKEGLRLACQFRVASDVTCGVLGG